MAVGSQVSAPENPIVTALWCAEKRGSDVHVPRVHDGCGGLLLVTAPTHPSSGLTKNGGSFRGFFGVGGKADGRFFSVVFDRQGHFVQIASRSFDLGNGAPLVSQLFGTPTDARG